MVGEKDLKKLLETFLQFYPKKSIFFVLCRDQITENLIPLNQ